MNAGSLVRLLGATALVSAGSTTDYYRHVLFDNSLNPDLHYYSDASAVAPSVLVFTNKKLPVERTRFLTPPNAIRLEWTSAPGGSWQAQILLEKFRNRPALLEGDTLAFWVYSAEALPSSQLPRLQLQDAEFGFTSPLPLADLAFAIPGGKWTRLAIPLKRFASASFRPFNPQRISAAAFLQGEADNRNHVLFIDEMRLESNRISGNARPAAPRLVEAKGYERHIDLRWDYAPSATAERFVIHRSFDGNLFEPIGTQLPGLRRFTDFLGAPDKKATYRVTASGTNYRESAPSNAMSAATRPMSDEELLTMVQEASFRYYWDGAHPDAGLTLECIPGHDDMIATGASGFGIMAILVGAERGFVSRAQALERLHRAVAFLEKADRHYGVWPHFLNGRTGKTMAVFGKYDNGADLVETSFLMQGLLAARQYFRNDGEPGQRLHERITRLWEAVDWSWFRHDPDSSYLYWHWSPDYTWRINHRLIGFNEVMITYLLAIASPKHPVPASLYFSGWASDREEARRYRGDWSQLTGGGYYRSGKTFYGTRLDVGVGNGGPLFFTHYSYLGFDPRVLRDGITNYFENNQNIAKINHEYCRHNPGKFRGYSERCWGLTASDGPQGYVAHEPRTGFDTGTMTPTGALASFPYTPDLSMLALKHFYRDHGPLIWGIYGFLDAFNEQENWISRIFMGLNQAPIAIMIENHRSGVVWKNFMANPEMRPALDRIAAEAAKTGSSREP